jgi:hypothetical protein
MTMRSTELRILRLEDLLPQGCPTCFRWGPETVRVVFGDDDGNDPETCPDCGRAVPVGRRIVIRTRLDGPQ